MLNKQVIELEPLVHMIVYKDLVEFSDLRDYYCKQCKKLNMRICKGCAYWKEMEE